MNESEEHLKKLDRSIRMLQNQIADVLLRLRRLEERSHP